MGSKLRTKVPMLAGKTLVDGSKKLVIHVTAADQNGSKSQSSGACAAARALCRENDDVVDAHVYLTTTFIVKARTVERYTTPVSLRTAIILFDYTGKFPTGDYHLNPPSPHRRLGAAPYRKRPSGSRGKTKPRMPRHVLEGVRPAAPRGQRGAETSFT